MERPEDTDRRLSQDKEPAVADDATAGYLENPWDPETRAKQKKSRRPKARVRGKPRTTSSASSSKRPGSR